MTGQGDLFAAPVTHYGPAPSAGIGGTWTGVLMPVRVIGPGEGIDEQAEEAAREAVDKMTETLDEHGATMSVTVDGEVTPVGKPKRGKKQQELVT